MKAPLSLSVAEVSCGPAAGYLSTESLSVTAKP